jgi:Arc/MetJ-type ribon-helix-helix transcriptional regulator
MKQRKSSRGFLAISPLWGIQQADLVLHAKVSTRKQIHSFGCAEAGIIEEECMRMNINLTPEQEKIISEELKSGHFRSVEEVIGEALQVLRAKELSSEAASSNGPQHEAVREMLEFVEKNRVRLKGVSVKQLIHEGHRL